MTRRATPLPRRRLVLDATAAGALRSTRRQDRHRAAVILAIAAADAGTTVPTSVRVEVGWDRRSPAWSGADRLVPHDDVLDTAAADLAASTLDPSRVRSGRAPSVADRHVAVAAHRQGSRGDVTVVDVLSSDAGDVRAVLDRLPRADGQIDVRAL
jgi:hypothetical protein